MAEQRPIGSRDPLAIDATIACVRCGWRSTLRSRRLRGVNDLSRFWPHWTWTEEGPVCPQAHG